MALANVLTTIRSGWLKARLDDIVTAADTPLAASTKDWGNRPTAKIIPIPVGANGIIIGFYGDNAAGDGAMENATAVSKIYVYQDRGPAEEVYEITLTIGAQEVGGDDISEKRISTAQWADTFASTGGNNSTRWLTTVGLADYQGDNGLAKISFDAQGADQLFIEIGTLTAGLLLTPVFRYY